ncbi:MAG: exopolysaccharide transport family protein [Xanthobacteraceae bacterium]|nr:exopolysaccharide transport family protein [Xanthobacteraceae bacterium]
MRREPASVADAVIPMEPIEGQLDFSALARAVWRRKRWVIIPTLFVAVASVVAVNVVTPRYRSETRIIIENRETVYNRPEGDRNVERDRPLLDPEAVQSQVQLAQSRDLARKVVRDLKLAERPEFNPEADGSLLGQVLSLIGLARDPSRMTIEERVLERYYDRLSVYQLEKSRLFAIDFQSKDPDLAAGVANAVAEGYLGVQQTAKQEAMRQAIQWLAGEIERLRGKVAEAEARVEEFRGKSNLYVGNNNNSLSSQQLGELNSQLVIARSQKAEAESKARSIREMLRTGKPIEASDILNSELIRRLNEQRVTLRAQLAEQSSTLLSQHPRIKELRAQIGDLEEQTRTEAEKLVRSFENDARITGARVETLVVSLDQMKRQASSLGEQDVQLRALEREAKAQRDLLESYLSRYRDATARETPDAVQPDARIVSRAVAASTPYFPKKIPIVLLATLATFMFAVTFIAMGELLKGDPGAEADMLARVRPGPIAPPARASRIGAARATETFAKARERLPDALADHVRGLGRGIVVVGRVGSDEPSPHVAVELARELAAQGARVLFLDLDVAAAPAAGLISDPRAPGLADLLSGVANFGEVIHRDRASRIHVIAVGRGVRDSAALLSAEKLSIVLGALSQTYDHVIVAAPALGHLAGEERLARFACAVVLVVAEGGEGTGAAASDALAAKGFANVMVVAAGPDAAPPGTSPDRAAA